MKSRILIILVLLPLLASINRPLTGQIQPAPSSGIREDGRALRCAYVKLNSFNCPAGETDIFNTVTAGLTGPGNVEKVQIAVQDNTNGGISYIDSPVNFYIDGEVAPSITIPLGHFIANYGSAQYTTWTTDTIGLTYTAGAGNPGGIGAGFRRIFIPYKTSCRIAYNNLGAAGVSLFTQVEYRQGAIPVWRGGPGTRRAKIKQATVVPFQSIAQLAVTDLINVSGVRGELEGIHFTVLKSSWDPATGHFPGWLEGHVVVTSDSSVFEYGGTEDFFGGQFYFSGLLNRTDSWGCSYQGAWTTGQATNCYRFFGRRPDDQMTFNSSMHITWQNGLPGINPSGTVLLATTVLYYVDH